MQVQCPKCKEWIDDESGTCPQCSSTLTPLVSAQPINDNPDVEIYLKGKKEALIQKIWVVSLAIIAFIGFGFAFVFDMSPPAFITAFIFWIAVSKYIDIRSDIKIRSKYGEISRQVRRFKVIWFTGNAIIAILTLIWMLPNWFWKQLNWILDSMPRIGHFWWHWTLLPPFIVGIVLIVGTCLYPGFKKNIATKAAEKKMLKG